MKGFYMENLPEKFQSPIYEKLKTPLFIRSVSNPPHWANNLIQDWAKLGAEKAMLFLRKHYWADKASVNVFRVVGTKHQEYVGKTWLELLHSGKRMSHNLPYQERNPDYYLETKPRHPDMHFVTLDGLNYYIGSDGNHRTCIAKFMFGETGETYLHAVKVEHFDIDFDFYFAYLDLDKLIRKNQLPFDVSVQTNVVKREDTAGWKIDYFEPTVLIKHWGSGEAKIARNSERLVDMIDSFKKMNINQYNDKKNKRSLFNLICNLVRNKNK